MEINSSSGIKLLVAAVVIVATAIVALVYIRIEVPPQPFPSTSASIQPTPTFGPEETPVPTPNVTVQWRGDGVKMPDLKLIGTYRENTSDFTFEPKTDYYDMGTNGSNKVIMATSEPMGPGYSDVFFFEQTGSGYTYMSRVSSYGIYTKETGMGYTLPPSVTKTDTTTFYNSVIGPRDLDYQGVMLQQRYLSPSTLFSDYEGIEGVSSRKVATLAQGDLYLREQVGSGYTDGSQEFYIRRYILKLPSGLYTNYDVDYAFFSDDYVPRITWSDGTQNKDNYRMDAGLGGCGNPGAYILSTRDVSRAVQITGTTSNGESIYEFKDINDPILKYFYTLSQQTMPLQEWVSHHALVLYKNSLGEYVLFTNDKYGTGAECGKPVIYLYPTEPTIVSVKVGADVTKSEPAYGTGWRVYADPSGELTMQDGQTYDSLFWEGLGHGNYPAITKGNVVALADVSETLEANLHTLGLSQKELDDFLEFWLPRMPDAPYVRLTWFDTAQMDELAPLAVWPKPDTSIRVFLDFQGLEKPISLPPQHLKATPRQGFTLVEWGGLLRE